VVALACSAPPGGRKRWTIRLLTAAAHERPGLANVNRETVRQMLKKRCKPWRKLMWCVGRITAEYRDRMYTLLGLYARPYNAQEPVVCVDEKSKQLLRQTPCANPCAAGPVCPRRLRIQTGRDTQHFVAIEPKGKRRRVEVTARRTKVDFVAFVKNLLETVYATAITVHLVLDNLNTHFRQTFVDVLGEAAAAVVLQRVQFHYTPKHASC